MGPNPGQALRMGPNPGQALRIGQKGGRRLVGAARWYWLEGLLAARIRR